MRTNFGLFRTYFIFLTGKVPDSTGRFFILTLTKILSGSKLRTNFGLFRNHSAFHVFFTEVDLFGPGKLQIHADKFQVIFGQFSDWTGHVSERYRISDCFRKNFRNRNLSEIFSRLISRSKIWTNFRLFSDNFRKEIVDFGSFRTNFGQIPVSEICPTFLAE